MLAAYSCTLLLGSVPLLKGGVFFPRKSLWGTHTLDFEKTVFFSSGFRRKKNNQKFLGENNFIQNWGVVEFWESAIFCILTYSTPEYAPQAKNF